MNACPQIKRDTYSTCPYRYEGECLTPICQKTVDEILDTLLLISSKFSHINSVCNPTEPGISPPKNGNFTADSSELRNTPSPGMRFSLAESDNKSSKHKQRKKK